MITKKDLMDSLTPITKQLNQFRTDVNEDLTRLRGFIGEELTKLRNNMSGIRNDLNKVKKDMNRGFKKSHSNQEVIIKFANEEIIELKGRVEKLEKTASPIN